MGDSARAPAAVWARRLAPWLVAAAILGFLATTTDLRAAGDAVARVSLPGLLGLMLALVATMSATDTFALWVPFREATPTARCFCVAARSPVAQLPPHRPGRPRRRPTRPTTKPYRSGSGQDRRVSC